MTEEGYILDVPLPLSQHFAALKEQGLAYIQAHSDYRWTNLNASDPGVTILDQICFALTELGYCNDFSIQDILAKKDGGIHIKDQFYLPADILTTSPVTCADYKKYLVDGVTNVDNAVLLANSEDLVSVYNTYLLINPSVPAAGSTGQQQTSRAYVCAAAFVYLNKARNLCEIFAMPAELISSPCNLSGTIEIENKDQLGNILQLIDEAIRNYIFAPVIPKSYKQLTADSERTDTIFDGPRLNNGWISTEMLGEKKDDVTIYEIIQLITAIPGVVSVTELYFSGDSRDKLHCKSNELLVINATTSYTSASLVFTCNNSPVNPDTFRMTSTTTHNEPGFESNILFGSGIDIRSDLPKAEYRNINSYYSIQNTFPAIYAVGPGAVDANATDAGIAQSRQLKGYLTLFDQVLANQFSQLANVEQLFSFKNAMTGTPSDTHWYYAVKDKQQQKNSMYPVPYLRFSPTYFFQSLYHIPGIKPLLAGNETFNFSLRPENGNVMEKKEWHRFRLDPYNSYIRGLMNMMEEEPASLRRRNEMLDHLLARHGESPQLINAYIDGSFYTRERIKDKVIFKSLYLQNLGLLSYNRYKAYNYLEAERFIKKFREPEPEEDEQTKEILSEFKKEIFTDLDDAEEKKLKDLVTRHNSHQSVRLAKWIVEGNTVDSVFDSGKVNGLEKLSENDFRNYSGIELKLNLLFGLKVLYRDFLISENEKHSNAEKLQALWLILERKGFILVEMPLLLCPLQFKIILADKAENGITIWQVSEQTDYETTLQMAAGLRSMNGATLDQNTKAGQLDIHGTKYALQPPQNIRELTAGYRQIPGTTYYYQVNAFETNKPLLPCPDFFSHLVFLFPAFIPGFTSADFIQRIKFFLGNELPVNITSQLKHAEASLLGNLVPAFIRWHDSMIAVNMDKYSITKSAPAAFGLLKEISNAIPFSAI